MRCQAAEKKESTRKNQRQQKSERAHFEFIAICLFFVLSSVICQLVHCFHQYGNKINNKVNEVEKRRFDKHKQVESSPHPPRVFTVLLKKKSTQVL